MLSLFAALRACLLTILVTGVAYPLAVTGLAQVLFSAQANGSLVTDGRGTVVGSGLIGQAFADAGYMHGRLSAAGSGYDATSSGGSNLGPTSQKLKDRISADITRIRSEDAAATGPLPDDLVTASASGLDPDISPRAALWQVERIATARGVGPERVRALVLAQVQGRALGFLGEPRVNVLAVNLALDRQFGTAKHAQQ